MGRRLPWKTSTTTSSADKKPLVKSDSPRASRTHSPSLPSASTPASSPSTSPPPEPPPERFMRPGPQHDDRYRMVEDEFVNMAHQFTTHLHRAEYNRLKSLAKSQNADTIREIERPVIGAPTLLARRRQESARRAVKQRGFMRNGDEEETPFVGRSLKGLMESPRKEHKWISGGMAGAAATRAAAGFDSQKLSPIKLRATPKAFSAKKRQLLSADDETDDGEDLDLSTPSRTPMVKSSRTAHTSSPTMARTPYIGKTSKHKDIHDDDEDDDPFGIKKRRIQRQKSKEQVRKVEQPTPAKTRSSLDDIPSFI
ncbi:uncharacterized protein NECHADRAFT_91020 [Fusarium vanettenii 77-13-4]|uniref:Uncharacterized protein n=1 Tax=Fusarium vanettenii (strain ATCC MYA-4622 / CBS 123669 / FGSC 9596 / NRRL 45880 / 77-13-4) TaxID=660122 RepID=C7Z7G8_FUSV7|nr:uncharacterized protein NECHADRAFT_91020 [Fusarium vanettenii 77-13-4]EEU40301.1 hypothetical protein NECHADRAFT_91020 [Fusarium vanettenii 77-13-4]